MSDRPILSAAALALIAAGLILPFAALPPLLDDSHRINLVWADQFTALMRQGEPWPRWLPWSYDGLGAPVFYFYGPVAFWIAGAFGLMGLATWPSLVMAALVALAASGLGLYGALRGRVRHPWAAAAFYMVAPYHLLDFLRRGALAEFTAAALLPFVAWGVARAIEGRPALLAMAFALLTMSHLPLALLATLFLVPMLVVGGGGVSRPAMGRVAAGLALGGGIAAAYLLPALALQPFTAMETMRAAPLLQPSHWSPASFFLAAANTGPMLLAAVGGALLLLAAILLYHQRDGWGWFMLAMLCLAFGLARPLWTLPGLDRVQFPWRILPLAEFGAAMMIGRSRLAGPRLLVAAAAPLLCSLLVVVPTLAVAGGGGGDARAQTAAMLLRDHPDVVEYLPHGVGAKALAEPGWPIALARRTPPAEQAAGFTTLRRFAFPIWRISCGGEAAASAPSPEGLLRYRGSGCAIERVTPPAERLGLAISAASLLGMALAALTGRRRNPAVGRSLARASVGAG